MRSAPSIPPSQDTHQLPLERLDLRLHGPDDRLVICNFINLGSPKSAMIIQRGGGLWMVEVRDAPLKSHLWMHNDGLGCIGKVKCGASVVDGPWGMEGETRLIDCTEKETLPTPVPTPAPHHSLHCLSFS